MIELKDILPDDFLEKQKIGQIDEMPILQTGEVLICTYTIPILGTQYVICEDVADVKFMQRSYDKYNLSWAIFSTQNFAEQMSPQKKLL